MPIQQLKTSDDIQREFNHHSDSGHFQAISSTGEILIKINERIYSVIPQNNWTDKELLEPKCIIEIKSEDNKKISLHLRDKYATIINSNDFNLHLSWRMRQYLVHYNIELTTGYSTIFLLNSINKSFAWKELLRTSIKKLGIVPNKNIITQSNRILALPCMCLNSPNQKM